MQVRLIDCPVSKAFALNQVSGLGSTPATCFCPITAVRYGQLGKAISHTSLAISMWRGYLIGSVRCPAHSYLLHVLPCCRSLDCPVSKAWPIYPFRSRPVPWIRARHPPGHHVDARCLSWPCAASIALKWRCTCPANTCVRCGLLLVNELVGAGSLPVHCEALPLNPRPAIRVAG